MTLARPGRHPGRRAALLGFVALALPHRSRAAPDAFARGSETIAVLEQRNGGRLGVAVLNTATGAAMAYRADERFPMCSTFKLLAAATMLKRVDDGQERLDRRISYSASDLQEYGPVTRARVSEGGMSLADLCAAALQWSDNTAANLLLRELGGPAVVTRYAGSLDDGVTRLDRNEPDLNTAIPGDERDTTSPRAMMRDLRALLAGSALAASSRGQLEAWLLGDQVGGKRLRAGLPASWQVGDKTGSGDHGTANTIAILRPPGRPPLFAAVYYTGSTAPTEARNAVHADVARIIVNAVPG